MKKKRRHDIERGQVGRKIARIELQQLRRKEEGKMEQQTKFDGLTEHLPHSMFCGPGFFDS